ncbi:MAG: hypothetical protein ACOY32_03785 [Thermodesulfobacteriota bacterium]
MYEKFSAPWGKAFQPVVGRDVLVARTRYEHALSHLEYGLRKRVRCLLWSGESGAGNNALFCRF